REDAALFSLRVARHLPAGSRHHGLAVRIHRPRDGDDSWTRPRRHGARMSDISRRTLITRGLVAAGAGLSGLAAARRIADRYGLIPPDHGGVYGPGETLTYAVHRLLTRRSLAREFSRSEISTAPFANETGPKPEAFRRLEADGFKGWTLSVDGLVARPVSLS